VGDQGGTEARGALRSRHRGWPGAARGPGLAPFRAQPSTAAARPTAETVRPLLRRSSVRAPLSAVRDPADRFTVADAVAGLMATGSIVLSFIAAGVGLIVQLDARPAVLAPAAAVVALVAARMSTYHRRLALAAVLIATIAWVVGMTVAVITENPII
jgi:hypothetical protein